MRTLLTLAIMLAVSTVASATEAGPAEAAPYTITCTTESGSEKGTFTVDPVNMIAVQIDAPSDGNTSWYNDNVPYFQDDGDLIISVGYSNLTWSYHYVDLNDLTLNDYSPNSTGIWDYPIGQCEVVEYVPIE
jgi:hypothetical protein